MVGSLCALQDGGRGMCSVGSVIFCGHFGFLLPLMVASVFRCYLTPGLVWAAVPRDRGAGTCRSTKGPWGWYVPQYRGTVGLVRAVVPRDRGAGTDRAAVPRDRVSPHSKN